jgi:hypothetical protein
MIGELIFELPGARQNLTMKALDGPQIDLLATDKAKKGVIDILAQRIIPDCLGIPFKEYRKFLDGDETMCIIALRRATWGNHFTFTQKCPDCGEENEFTVDLSTLKVRHLHPDQPLQGLEYEICDDDGELKYVVVWHLPRVFERLQMEKELKEFLAETRPDQDYYLTFNVAMRVDDILMPSPDPNDDELVSIPAIAGKEGKDRRRAVREYIMDRDSFFGAGFLQQFLSDIEEFSCGVDTATKCECYLPSCAKTWSAELPIQEGFFFLTKDSLRKQKQRPVRSHVRTPWKMKKEEKKRAKMEVKTTASEETSSTSTPSEPPTTPPETITLSATTDQAPSSNSSQPSSPVPISARIPKST